mgnify:CR=1 FL=1
MKLSPEISEIIRHKDRVIGSLEHQVENFKRYTEELKRQVENLTQALFGSSSERQNVVREHNPDQPFLPFPESSLYTDDANPEPAPGTDEKSSSDKDVKKDKQKKKKSGSNRLVFPDNIEVEHLRIDVPCDEKTDPISGAKFSKIGEESIEKLVRVKSSYKKIVITRSVYGAGNSGIVKADWPQSVLGFTRLDESFWTEAMVRRTCDHQPFHRQVQTLAREGISITRQALSKGHINIGTAFYDLGLRLRQEILKLPAIFVDETSVKAQVPGKKALHSAYLWLIAGRPAEFRDREPLVWMDFKMNRKHENAPSLILDYDKVVHSDAYEAYEKLADKKQFTWAPCWVHARRKFIKATENDIQQRVVQLFTNIMHLDNQGDHLQGQARVTYRLKEVQPAVLNLIKELEKIQLHPRVMVSKSLSEACSYFLKRQDYFKTFLKEPCAEMDNNAVERSIRPLKIGMKNWLFIGSDAGGKACAVMTSLLQSAKNIGLNPQQYLENVLRRLPYTAKEDLDQLLPHKWQKKVNPKSPFLPPDYIF